MVSREVIVVGAGIVGSSIAYQLAAAGAGVTLIDAALPGSGATKHSFAWIGRSPQDSSPEEKLRSQGRDHWHRLAQEVPELEVHWTGALVWGEYFSHDGAPQTDRAEVIEPNLVMPPNRSEQRADDGWLDPVRATESLVRAAQRYGASTRFGSPVSRLARSEEGTVIGVELGTEVLPASTVVVAAGTGSTALCATANVDLPMVSSPSVMVQLHAPPGIVQGIIANDHFEARQSTDGTTLMPVEYNGETSTEDLGHTGEEALRVFQKSFRGSSEASLKSVEIGWRPMPANGESTVGYSSVPGLYIAVAHPGIMLGSVIGHTAAEEILRA
ncbi:FAD-binding oxidoreductase [Paenarthrobacter sp. A20]|uniref:NAD(P)/FAD-dependent oxidoreductase n=1 Tax=Paenarthrobacter sp. A20 TaxID=2817891 RepID=UPI00209FD106|nr:FAD-dependent oxidoreductase [Paenarthrobacter sp. A20]MCP1415483.1 glycine/D-amino acid oxidase-like deaminating enzyme [Paenarthrobacter sp. A20]